MNPLRPVDRPVPNTLVDRMVTAGAVALVTLTVFVVAASVATRPHLISPRAPDVHKVAVWFALAAHNLSFHVTVDSQQFPYPMAAVPGWHVGYKLLPPIALFLGGFGLARQAPLPNGFRGVLEGARIGVVYTPLVVLLALLSFHVRRLPPSLLPPGIPEGQSFVLGTDLGGAVLLAGIGYPIVFAGAGGMAVYELERHFERSSGGHLHRLDRFFGALERRRAPDRSSVPPSRPVRTGVRAGCLLTAAQLPGFVLTHLAFRHETVVLGHPELFPFEGYLLFTVVSLLLSTGLWWYRTRTDGFSTGASGFRLGFAVGLAVHVVVWTTAFVATWSPAGELPFLTAAGVFLLLTTTVGWLQGLGAALMGGLLANAQIETRLFREIVG